MKTNLLSSTLALVALCSALNLTAETNSTVSRRSTGEISLDHVVAVVPANGDTVTAGTSRVMVSARLGSPSAVLADGSWLYYNYTANQADRESGRFGTLVVRFVGHKVSTLTLADKAAVLALRSAPRPLAGDKFLAANQRR